MKAGSMALALLGAGLLFAGGMLAFAYLRFSDTGPDLAKEARDDLDSRGYKPLSGTLGALLNDASVPSIPTQADPLLNRPAPDFTLDDTDGKTWPLQTALEAGPVVVVFYYGYHCNHCVSQLFALDKDLERFRDLGATVVAISADEPVLTRERFKKYGAFHFPVLSDPGYKIAEAYGTFAPSKKEGEDGNQLHGTFVLDRHGKVVWANRGEGPFTHNLTLLREIQRVR